MIPLYANRTIYLNKDADASNKKYTGSNSKGICAISVCPIEVKNDQHETRTELEDSWATPICVYPDSKDGHFCINIIN